MWSYGSWIYHYLCNQSLPPLMLWVRIQLRRGIIDTCDKVCQWLEVVFSGFLHQSNWLPQYNWNIVESGLSTITLTTPIQRQQKKKDICQSRKVGLITYEYRCAPTTTEEPTRQNRTEHWRFDRQLNLLNSETFPY